MQPIDRKPAETPENNFYGVDVNNRTAVEQEFERLRKQHRNVTILVIVFLLIFGFFIYDFIRVTELEGKPVFATSEEVDGGTKFKGIGYEVLYCTSGERYVGPAVYKKCGEQEATTISNMVYKKFVNYAVDKKILNKDRLDSLEFVLVEYDGKNEDGGGDYHVNLKYTCKDDKKCLTLTKEYEGTDNINIYIRFDKFNEVSSIVYFKDNGKYYDSLVELYKTNIQTYLAENEKLDVDNLRDIKIKLLENHGKYKFRDVVYADSYLIQISYLCKDNTNTCVHALDDNDIHGGYTNLSFNASLFLDKENNVKLIGPKEYFDL